jgi:hypothetical protein
MAALEETTTAPTPEGLEALAPALMAAVVAVVLVPLLCHGN